MNAESIAVWLASTALALAAAWFVLAHKRRSAQARNAQSLAAERALESARKYRHVYYSAPVALLSIDAEGKLLRWNDMAQTLFGSLLQRGRLNLVGAVLGDARAREMHASIEGTGRFAGELELKTGDGVVRACSVEAHLVGNAIELSVVDVSERVQLTRTLEHIAHHDYLTDLLDRRGLERALGDLLRRMQQGEPASLVYVDLDRFKAINDVFGHAAGDAVVVEVGRRIAASVPGEAAVARIGGDEFVVVLPGMELAAARATAGRIRQALSGQSHAFEGTMFDVDASIGVIEASSSMQVRELIAYADVACARSKRSGRGRITALRPDHEALNDYRAEVRYGSQLKSSLPADRLRLHAQPIVPLREREPVGYEVLLRAEAEDGTLEPPARLIAAAERHGEMPAVDRFVLQHTVAHLAEHPGFAREVGFVTVNMSGMSLNNDRFRRDAVALLRSNREVASRLCLEITESVALFDVATTRRFIEQMRELGVRIALDDFGAGYSSFAYLKELPASMLKIDGQFVLRLADEPRHQGVIRAIRQLSLEFGMQCVAEWVEDVRTLRTLVELGVDYAQGFVFARPRALAHWLDGGPDLSPLAEARRDIAARTQAEAHDDSRPIAETVAGSES